MHQELTVSTASTHEQGEPHPVTASKGVLVSRRFSFDPLLVVIFLLASYLALVRLDNTAFWDDEAHISIMARNFLHTGTWTGWDGRNLLGYGNGIVLEPNLRHIIPQLDAPVMAASFALFGETTWAGRFPFVVAGLLSLLVFALLLRREFPRQRSMQLFAFASLAFSVQFLLAVRVCRYYALAILFSLLVFSTYRRCVEDKRLLDFMWLGLWSLLLFLTSCLNGGAFLGALALLHFVFYRKAWNSREWTKAAVAVAVFLVGAVPYALVNRIWDFPLPVTQPWLQRKSIMLLANTIDLNTLGMSWLVALGLLFLLTAHYLRPAPIRNASTRDDTDYGDTDNVGTVTRRAVQWAVLVLGYTFFVSMLSPLEFFTPFGSALRYLFPLLPFIAVLNAAFLWLVWRRMKLLAVALFLLLICTNLLSLTPRERVLQLPLLYYIGEVHQPYPTAYSEALRFLDAHARPDERVLAIPDHMNYPLMFYRGDRLRFACLLNRRTHLPLQTIAALPAPLLAEENFPDWLIALGNRPMANNSLRYFSRPHWENGQRVEYSYRLFTTLDVFFEQTQRPEIPWHSFGPHRNFDRTQNAVYIYRRVLRSRGGASLRHDNGKDTPQDIAPGDVAPGIELGA
ncbi:MAG TPA: glycosyltransferase family 39 protein [Abditibacteriaceae bacterium]|jgi:hypothetical protein